MNNSRRKVNLYLIIALNIYDYDFNNAPQK